MTAKNSLLYSGHAASIQAYRVPTNNC